jgi:hypothetical protein
MAEVVMSSVLAMSLMGLAEFVLWSAICFLFWTKKLARQFPVMGIYLVLHMVATPILLVLFYGQEQYGDNSVYATYYFYCYWIMYIASAVLLFFVCMEVFHSVLAPFTGLLHLGTIVFRWVALVSILVSFSTISFRHINTCIITNIALRLMRSMSILELCLLAFLCLSMNALHLSVRDLSFGITTGFGLMSSTDFIVPAFLTQNAPLTANVEFVAETMILISLGIWVAYCALPEKEKKPILLPAKSFILRWNEIATALGHTGTQVAIQPSNGFYLTREVEPSNGLRHQKLRDSRQAV